MLPSSTCWRGWGWRLLSSPRLSCSPGPRGNEADLLARWDAEIDGSDNRFDHTIEILSDVRIPEPDHVPAVSLQRGRSSLIRLAFSVLRTIGLDDQPRPAAGEVRNKRSKPKLAGEARPDLGQRTPQRFLCWSRIIAQRARETEAALRFGGHGWMIESSPERDHPLAPSTQAWRGNPQYICWPPLMLSVLPVMKPPSSAQRKVTPRAISLAWPSRPTGILATIFSSTSGGTAATMSVSI